MPNTSVPRPPTPHSTLATVSTRESDVAPSTRALKTTTVATIRNAASTCRKRSQSYTRREPYPFGVVIAWPRALGHTRQVPLPLIEFPADDAERARRFWR